jgi:hypothetical protein
MSFAVEEDPGSDRLLVALPSRSSGPVTPVRRSSSAGGSLVWRVTASTWARTGIGTSGRTGSSSASRRRSRYSGARPTGSVSDVTTSSSLGMGAACALMMGLAWGAGTVVGGGVPVLSGTLLQRIANREATGGGGKRAAASVIESARQGNADDDPVSFLNGLFFRLATNLHEPVTGHFITSPSDYADAGPPVRPVRRRPPQPPHHLAPGVVRPPRRRARRVLRAAQTGRRPARLTAELTRVWSAAPPR